MENCREISIISRPLDAADLVRRIQQSSVGEDAVQQKNGSLNIQHPKKSIKAAEVDEALRPLLRDMVRAAQERHWMELVYISSVARGEDYEDIVTLYANSMIIKGTVDETIVDAKLLHGFAVILENGSQNTAGVKKVLGAAMLSLQKRLETSTKIALPESQYPQLMALSTVLNAMVTNKISGISRVRLHEPLFNRLAALKAMPDIRISQAARYCTQALLGIPDDETQFQKVIRTGLAVLKPLFKLASAGFGGDLTKVSELIEDYKDYLEPSNFVAVLSWVNENSERVLEFVNTIKEEIEDIYNKDLNDINFKDMADIKELWQWPRQKSWYMHLRYVELFVRAGAFNMVRHHLGFDISKRYQFLKDLKKKENSQLLKDESFVCGLLSCLEQTWNNGQHREQIVDLLQMELLPKVLESSSSQYVLAWCQLVTQTFQLHEWTKKLQKKHKMPSWLHKEQITKLMVYTPKRDLEIPRDLFLRAWAVCKPAHRFYADSAIRKHYISGDLLKIQRISGAPLNIEHCYINVAIISHKPETAKKKSEKALLTLFERLKVNDGTSSDRFEDNRVIPLPAIFDLRAQGDGSSSSPRRILFRGRAGIGKTTLCKYIIHRFLYENLWANLFDRLLWIPLRNLKRNLERNSHPIHNQEQLFVDQFFTQCAEDEAYQFSTALREKVGGADAVGDSRTLFILDGLDEVTSFLGEVETPARNFLKELMNRRTVIVTSRPSGTSFTGLDKFDLELETLAFNSDQVTAYVKMANPSIADSILEFIKGHALVQKLASIPIQLDAFCFTWNPRATLEKPPTTMTGLYNAISSKLWRISLPRLFPEVSWRAEHLTRYQIKRQVQDYSTLLGAMAFTGMYNGLVEFEASHRDVIAEIWSRETDSMLIADDILQSSFLRTSESNVEPGHAAYHFLHLTYQEYFAAQFFVDNWRQGHDLWWYDYQQKSRQRAAPEKFLQQQKYNPHFDILWRFTTGLLSSSESDDDLSKFFAALDSEPIDLLGPAHQRLVLHCFSEVEPSGSLTRTDDLRVREDRRLMEWASFDMSAKDDIMSLLIREPGFPDHLLQQLLASGSKFEKVRTLQAIRNRQLGVSDELIQLVAQFLEVKELSTRAMYTLIDLSRWDLVYECWVLDLSQSSTCDNAIRCLLQGRVPIDFIGKIELLLNDENSKVAERALDALCQIGLRQEIPPQTHNAIKLFLRRPKLSGDHFASAFWFLIRSETAEDLSAIFLDEYHINYKKYLSFTTWVILLSGAGVMGKLVRLLDTKNDSLKELAKEVLLSRETLKLSLQYTPIDLQFLQNTMMKKSTPWEIKYRIAQLLALPPNLNGSAISFLREVIEKNGRNAEEAMLYLLKFMMPLWLCTIAHDVLTFSGRQFEVKRLVLNLRSKELPEQIVKDLLRLCKTLVDGLSLGESLVENSEELINDILIALNRQSNITDDTIEESISSARKYISDKTLLQVVMFRRSISEKIVLPFATSILSKPKKTTYVFLIVWPLIALKKLPPDFVNLLTTSLSGENIPYIQAAANVFLGRKDCHAKLPELATSALKNLYKVWQWTSKSQPLAVYVMNHELCIWTSEGLSSIPFQDKQEQAFLEAFRSAQREMGGPDSWGLLQS